MEYALLNVAIATFAMAFTQGIKTIADKVNVAIGPKGIQWVAAISSLLGAWAVYNLGWMPDNTSRIGVILYAALSWAAANRGYDLIKIIFGKATA